MFRRAPSGRARRGRVEAEKVFHGRFQGAGQRSATAVLGRSRPLPWRRWFGGCARQLGQGGGGNPAPLPELGEPVIDARLGGCGIVLLIVSLSSIPVWLLTMCLLLAGCGRRAEPHKVSIAAAADLHFALEEVSREFRAAHPDVDLAIGVRLLRQFYAQIRNQAPFDILLRRTWSIRASSCRMESARAIRCSCMRWAG